MLIKALRTAMQYFKQPKYMTKGSFQLAISEAAITSGVEAGYSIM